MADSTKHSGGKQPRAAKSLTNVRHKHEWVLLEKGDTKPKYRPLPKGQWVQRGGLFGGVSYIPGFDREMLNVHIIDTIQNSELPWYTYQKWQCPECGKVKTYEQRHGGITEMLTKISTKGTDLVALDLGEI